MGKLLRKAIQQQKQQYIDILLQNGFITDPSLVANWTITELENECIKYGLQTKQKKEIFKQIKIIKN